MRILHVIPWLAPRYGGPVKVLPEMCSALVRRGHDVEIATTNIDGAGTVSVPTNMPLSIGGVTVRYFEASFPRRYAWSWPLARFLRTKVIEFDIVHVHGIYRFPSLAAGIACRRSNIPYVIRPHGTLDVFHRSQRTLRKAIYDALLGKRNLESAKALHLTSKLEQAQVKTLGTGVRGFVIPSGVATDLEVGSQSYIDSHADLHGKMLVVNFGRLTVKKGLNLLIEAFVTVSQREPNAHLLIAGPDDEDLKSELVSQVANLHLGNHVSIEGFLNSAEKRALLGLAHVFVLPSLDENFGVSAVEAMAEGVPIIISPNVGIAEEVAEAGAGLVVPRRKEDISAAILRVIQNPDLARELSARAEGIVRNRFSWDVIVTKIEEMYEFAVTSK